MSCWSPTLLSCLLLVAGLHLSSALPCSARQDRARSEVLRRVQTAALPESNEAMLLAGRASEAVKQGEFRLAIELIEQIMNLPDALVADPEHPVYYPVWRQARRLLAALPPDGLAYYRQIVDPEAGVSFREAIESSDVAALRRLFRAYPASSVAPRIGSELVSRLMENGDYDQAVDMLHELDSSADAGDDAFARRARLLVSLARLGAWQSAAHLLESLERDRPAAGNPLASERIDRLRIWIAELRHGGNNNSRRADEPLVPAIGTDITWERSLRLAAESAHVDDDVSIARAIDEYRRLPLVAPIISGDALVVRLAGQLWVHDLLSLTRRWQAAEINADERGQSGPVPRFGQPIAPVEIEGGEAGAISSETRDLLFHSLRHAASVGFGNVYTIESLSRLREPSSRRRFRRGLFRRQDERVSANYLVARELATGRQVWKAGADMVDPLYGVAFQDTPIVVGDQLVVPVQRDDDILLCALDPTSGRLLREMPIVGPPTVFSGAGGRCLLARDDTTIYVCTGNGIIAAISGATWEWKWAAAYPSTLGKQLASRVRFQFGRNTTRSSPPMRPFVAGGLLIVAPIDSNADEIMALDRFSGRVRWRAARADHVAIVGVIDDRLILCGNTVTCVDLADGNTVLWRSIPIELSGRPVIHGRRVYVPARDALLVLDADTGKIVDDRLHAAGEPGVGNLAASDDALLSVSPRRIIKYPDVAATRASCGRIIEERHDDPRARLSLAWIEMLSGDYQSALSMIEAMGSAEAALESEREELLVRLFVSLSNEAPAGQDKLAWLRRAESLSQSSRTAGQMGMLIGRALDEAGRLSEAFSHYRGMLLAADSPMIRHSGRRIVAWLHAARRARALLPRVSQAQRTVWEDGLLSVLTDGGGQAEMLRRGLMVVDGAASQRLSRALLIQSRRPEVVIDYLSEPDDETLPLPERRALQLVRWETHLALGMIDQAEQDRDYWREVFAIDIPVSQPTSRGAVEAEQLNRVRKLETARKKLLAFQAAAPDYDTVIGRRWMLGRRSGGFQLVYDPRRPRAAQRPWLLVRDLNEHELQLRNAVRGQELRVSSAATISAAMPGLVVDDTSERFVFGGFDHAETDTLATWPAVIQGHKAVVPVRGGLVCVGLGPERGGGTRLWEYEIAQPFDIANDFSDRAVGGPHGLYFAYRDDRIVCLDFSNGEPRWERDFADLRVDRLFVSGDQLVVVGQNREIVVLDGQYGDNLRTMPVDLQKPERVTVIGDTVVLAMGRALLGLSAETLERRWDRSCDSTVTGWFAVPERNWLAYREITADKWTVINAASGREQFAAEIPVSDEVTAAAVVGGQLLLAGLGAQTTGEGHAAAVWLSAIDLDSGRVVWRHESVHIVPINTTQLVAHPRYIPILTAGGRTTARGAEQRWRPEESRDLGIELLDRNTGRLVGKRTAIASELTNGRSAAGAFLLATSSRMIVAANGRVVAYGTSPYEGNSGN